MMRRKRALTADEIRLEKIHEMLTEDPDTDMRYCINGLRTLVLIAKTKESLQRIRDRDKISDEEQRL